MVEDAKTELAEEFEEAWKRSDAEPQADLTNLIFTLYEAEHIDYEYKGAQRKAFICRLAVRGEEVERAFWIGGKTYNQIALLLEKNVLPVVVKQAKDGTAYKLMLQDAPPQPRPELRVEGSAAQADGETLDASETPAAIDVGALFNEAVLISDDDGVKVVGMISDAGLDAIMDVGGDSKVFIKTEMAIGNRVKAINLLNDHLEAEKKARAAS